MQAITDFLHENHTATLCWPEGRLEEFINWNLRHRTLGVVRDGDRIVGVAVARPVNDPANIKPYELDEGGNTVLVDMAVAESPRVLARMWDLIFKRFGVREKIAFKRKKYRGRLRVYQFGTFLKSLARKESHGRR